MLVYSTYNPHKLTLYQQLCGKLSTTRSYLLDHLLFIFNSFPQIRALIVDKIPCFSDSFPQVTITYRHHHISH